jgi:hypothetical protein
VLLGGYGARARSVGPLGRGGDMRQDRMAKK